MALLSGISETKILEIKQTEIHEKASQSIKSKGWLPNLFRGIVIKAKDFLQNLICKTLSEKRICRLSLRLILISMSSAICET